MGSKYSSAALGGSKPQPVVGQHGIPRTLVGRQNLIDIFLDRDILFDYLLKGLI